MPPEACLDQSEQKVLQVDWMDGWVGWDWMVVTGHLSSKSTSTFGANNCGNNQGSGGYQTE